VLFLKLFHRVYAPLAAAAIDPMVHDAILPDARRPAMDQLYVAVDRALNLLLDHLGLANAA
jgi:hypothetical protein